MPLAFELLFTNRVLRAHWLKRLEATALDVLTVFIPVWVIAVLSGLHSDAFYLFIGLASGIFWFLYSSMSEYFYGYTLGKKLTALRVSSERGELLFYEVLFRNLPKLFWYFLLPFDILLGMFTFGDPRQRFFDRLFNTTVVSTLPASSLLHVKVKQSKPA